MPLAEGIHQLLQLGSSLDLEEDLIVVVCDLDVEMLTWAGSLGLLGGTWASVVVRSRHFDTSVRIGVGCE